MTKNELNKITNEVYELEQQISALRIKLEPLRDVLIDAVEYGKTATEDHIIIKSRIEEAIIPEHIRKAYDKMQVK